MPVFVWISCIGEDKVWRVPLYVFLASCLPSVSSLRTTSTANNLHLSHIQAILRLEVHLPVCPLEWGLNRRLMMVIQLGCRFEMVQEILLLLIFWRFRQLIRNSTIPSRPILTLLRSLYFELQVRPRRLAIGRFPAGDGRWVCSLRLTELKRL